MESSTTIRKMFAGNQIYVPSYQRAYSWDTETDKSKPTKQVNVFLSDLEEHEKSLAQTNYYFGHFLFEERESDSYGVVDGQQRMTTIVIFVAALLKCLKEKREWSETELDIFEDFLKRRSIYRFETVDYDKQLFKDYIVDKVKISKACLNTESSKRIVAAYDFFIGRLQVKSEEELLNLLEIVSNASCTTHSVKDESEAIQMFIFQNNRGKKPSNLEIIKAQFMFYAHLYAGEEKRAL